MYVLVLGLDVLGNPFGVIRGLAEGIEDLFYEPYQGAIQGPEEFAEGLALGVKSMLGHAVGEYILICFLHLVCSLISFRQLSSCHRHTNNIYSTVQYSSIDSRRHN